MPEDLATSLNGAHDSMILPTSGETLPQNPQQDRIPSLSRSEVSETDTSGGASTPEGPTRAVAIASPSNGDSEESSVDDGERVQQIEEATFESRPNEADDTHRDGLPTMATDDYSSNANDQVRSATKVISSLSTPSTSRGRRIQGDNISSTISSTPGQSTVLQDITTCRQDSRGSNPFTPSSLTRSSKAEDFVTPRAPLDDALRRKNHVLAVLSSSGLPTRTMKHMPRGTPHPLRRVSTAGFSKSVAEECSPTASHYTAIMFHSQNSKDATLTQSANESFVSIASSADLTSDRRAANMQSRQSRGNVSFPTIMLPTNAPTSSPGGSLTGFTDRRADGVKIHKHLNAMNKQLLDTNAVLAREAEAWRDEVNRLRGVLKAHGVEIEEIDVVVLGLPGSVSYTEMSERSGSGQQDPTEAHNVISRYDTTVLRTLDEQSEKSDRSNSAAAASRPNQVSARDLLEGLTPEEYWEVMHEMAERLEALEEGLTDKDRVIDELQRQVEAAEASLRSQTDELGLRVAEREETRANLHAKFAIKTEQHAKQFGEICSGFEEQVKLLESQLATVNSEADELRSDKTRLENLALTHHSDEKEQEMLKQIADLENELGLARQLTKASLVEAENLERQSTNAHTEHRILTHEVETGQTQIVNLEARLEDAKEAMAELEVVKIQRDEARNSRDAAEDQLARMAHDISSLRRVNIDKEAGLERQYEQISASEQEVQELKQQLVALAADRKQDHDLGTEVESLRLALHEAHDALAEFQANNRNEQPIDSSGCVDDSMPSSPLARTEKSGTDERTGFVKVLENQLDDAFREIGRLKHELSATPHHNSSIEIRDTRIQALQREKGALTDRLAALTMAPSTPIINGIQSAGPPFNHPTPFAHRATTALRIPRTPGPLKDVSNLHLHHF